MGNSGYNTLGVKIMAQKQNQCKRILAHLQSGLSITQAEAASMFDCWRLGARIKDLRDAGHPIITINEPNQNGGSHARYVLARKVGV